MKKRIAALILAVLCILTCLTGCHDKQINGEDIKGSEIKIFLSELVYDLDPAYCLNNDSALQICGLLYDTLFTIDANGKLQKSLVDNYKIIKDEKNDEYIMQLELRDDTSWSDGVYVSAEDVVFAWKRILDASNNSDAAALLYDIKNAKEAKAGDCSIDDVGIYAVDELVLQISFVGDIDYDAFLLNLTSVALAPLKEITVSANVDWSKKPATTVCSGPFMIRRVNYGTDTDNKANVEYTQIILERNPYYRRTADAKYVDTSVTPYRLILDFAYASKEDTVSMAKENVLNKYVNGTEDEKVFYIGDIALSQRAAQKDNATVTDLMSTHTYYFNENAEILKKDGTTEKLFANKNVRLALSAVIDRNAIAEAVVFAKAADAFVPNKVFNVTSAKEEFRTVGGSLISTSADTAKAQSLLAEAGITASDWTFTILVRAEDEVHMQIATMVSEAWMSLGFNVNVKAQTPDVNDDKLAGEDVKDIYDDTFNEKYYDNNYEVIAVDVLANAPTAMSFLAPFATGYSGQGQDMSAAELLSATPSKCGYVSEAYDAKFNEIFSVYTAAERAPLLHEAEQILLEDMAVMPVIFNQNATLCSGDLTDVTMSYYGFHIFTKASLKNWINYIETTLPEEEETAAP